MFGQPRFFDMTQELIKEEFDLEGHSVDFHASFWDKIGYTPEGEEHNYDTENFISNARENINFKNLQINNYEKLNEFTEFMIYFAEKIHNRKLPIGRNYEYMRYKFGQHWCIKDCFQRIKRYEEKNKFKYDLIIKCRTDIVYRPKTTYTNTEEYNKIKNNYYGNILLDKPAIKCNALRVIDISEKRKDKKNPAHHEQISIFYDEKFVSKDNSSTYFDYVENYNLRLAFNDWSLIANREAAEIIYGKWFENYFLTLSKDIKNTNDNDSRWFISESDHSIQGQFLLNYKIHATREQNRRDARLLHPEIIKKDVDIKGKILAYNKATIISDCHKKFCPKNLR